MLEFQSGRSESGTPDSLYEWINTERLPDPLNVNVRCRGGTFIDYGFAFSLTPVVGRLNVGYQRVVRTPVPASIKQATSTQGRGVKWGRKMNLPDLRVT